MLTLLISLFGSSGFGALLGIAGGLANRYMDQRSKAADQSFELQKMDKEAAIMKEEWAGRVQVAGIEAEGKIEAAAYGAMASSYGFAATDRSDGLVDKVSKVLRPLLTFLFFCATIYIFVEVSALVEELQLRPSTEEVWSLYKYIIYWIFFQAGTAIGWWFAMRPGKMPSFGVK